MKARLLALAFLAAFSSPFFAQNWQPVSVGLLPADFQLHSISVVSDQVVWAIADSASSFSSPGLDASYLPFVMRTTDGGATWDSIRPTEAQGRWGWDIVGFDANTAIFTTNQFATVDEKPVFKTTDGGATWKKIVPPNGTGGLVLHFFDAQNGVAINRARVSTTSDGGETWAAVPAANIPSWAADEYNLLYTSGNFAAFVGDRCWIGTSKGRVMRSIDRGKTWEMFKIGATTDVINSIAFSDSLNGVAAAPESSSAIYTNSKLFSTSDGGKTWSPLPAAPQKKVYTIAAVPGAANHYLTGSFYFNAANVPKWSFNSNDLQQGAWAVQMDSIALDCAEFLSPKIGYAAGWSVKAADEIDLPSGLWYRNYIFKWTGDLTATDEKTAEKGAVLALAPNPTDGFLAFEAPFEIGGDGVLASVLDAAGRAVFSAKIFEKRLDVGRLAAGFYILKIEKNGQSASTRFVKN